MLLNDAATGMPVAILDARWITGVRTAAITAVAARRLARPESARIGFIACGLQARAHLAALKPHFPLATLRAYSCRLSTAQKFVEEARAQGLAAEVYQHGIAVTCVSPSQVVPTPGTVFHKLVRSLDDPRGESPELMAKATLLLATEPIDKVTGRVTYSQLILKEFGWIDDAKGIGIDGVRTGTGYSQI